MRIPCFDGLRAVAITLVLLSHLQHSGVPSWVKSMIASWAPGNVGVRLFFMISGFLITHILNLELQKDGKINFKKFFARRVLRIFPAFYCYLLALVLLSYVGIIRIDFYEILFASLYVENFSVVHYQGWWLVSHAWSLSIEEQFYLIFPFILGKLKAAFENHTVQLIVLMTCFCSSFRALSILSPRLSLMTGGVFFMYCDYFFYGAVLAIVIWKSKDRLGKLLRPYRYGLLVLAFVVLIYSSKVEFYSVVNILVFGNLVVVSIFYLLLFFLLFPDSVVGKVLELRAIRVVGLLSYSLYLWQQLFLGAAADWAQLKFATLFPYNLVLVLACAILSYLFIERPFLRMKSRYS